MLVANNNDDNLLQDLIIYWTNRAKGYSQTNQDELATDKRKIWQKLILNHAPNKNKLRILDIGTGPGFLAITLALAGHEVTAVDVTQAMIDQAKDNASQYRVKVNFVLSDVHCLPFDDNHFDLIVLRNVTWNLSNPTVAYQEWFRVLNSQGKLLNFDANWYLFLFNKDLYSQYMQDRQNTMNYGIEDHYRQTNTQEMERIAKLLPLSKEIRPEWDMNILQSIGYKNIHIHNDISKIVWDEIEQINYHSTPMFLIAAEKQ
ncbi:SAM-dependent methyltransferase [Gilliamella apicola]|uniref:SAM-dependent methyltransferase n=1 Tax=Gilliamella apicola TaxID=1196095 RepID=A0A2V4DZE2_9GAMM|nr:class I SAM-dependent methyltransferase [Gilliamella apicola]PXZ04899.1 SAM-dependent methyltransferase [Gilliamella apicola]